MTDQKLDENSHLNLNDEAIALINNFLDDQVDNSALLARSNFWKKFLDSRRDYDDECGYPKTNEITPEHYQTLYDREAIATRVVELMPAECWSSAPIVYETEKQTETEFETAWNDLATKLNPSNRSWLDAQDSHPVWHYLHRVDVLSGISRFGIVLLGINDGLDLREPVRGLEEQGSIPSKEVDREQKKAKLFPSDSEDAVSLNVVTNRHEGFTTDNRKHEEYQLTINQEKTAKNDLLYLRTFPESLVDIVQYETNEDSPRYGQPVMYSVTFNDPLAPAMGIGQPLSTQHVHWTRIIHVCDNLESSELFGVPRQRPVYNNLLNLHKVYGGSAEMYWQGAFPGLSFETQPQQGRDATIDKAAMRGQITNYFNSLQRYLLLRGMTAKTISPQVVDPTSQIEIQIDAICIRLGVPKRIFMGSERGELASGQDAKTWNRRVMYRQDRYITPRIIAPFIDRLIMIGVLPEPKQYVVEWPDLNTLTDQEKADLAVKYTGALAKYVGGGVDNLVEPTSYLVHLLGLDPEQVEDILQATLKHLDEAKSKSSEETTLGRPNPTEGESKQPNEDGEEPTGSSENKAPSDQNTASKVDKGVKPLTSNSDALNDNDDHGQDEYGSWTTDHDYTMGTGDFLVNSEGKSEKLNQPFRTPDGPKKFGVYVKNDKGNVVLVRFGDPDMEIKRDDPERRKSFRARHGCDTDPGPKWKPKYWSCKMWESGKTVSDVTNHLGGFPVNHLLGKHPQQRHGSHSKKNKFHPDNQIKRKDESDRLRSTRKNRGSSKPELETNVKYPRGMDSEIKEADKAFNKPEIFNQLNIPSKMYHITERSNVESIQKNGLKIDKPRTSQDGVILGSYLANNPSDFSDPSFGDLNIKDPVILEVDTKGLKMRLDPEYLVGEVGYEKEFVESYNRNEMLVPMYVPSGVPASHIRITTVPTSNSEPKRRQRIPKKTRDNAKHKFGPVSTTIEEEPTDNHAKHDQKSHGKGRSVKSQRAKELK